MDADCSLVANVPLLSPSNKPGLAEIAQVPVLLDTNVSCPEGINEVLAEDDVSWQLKPVRERGGG